MHNYLKHIFKTTLKCKDVTRLCPQVFAGMQAQVHPHSPPSKVLCGYEVCVPMNSNLQGRDPINSFFANCHWIIDTISYEKNSFLKNAS